MFEHLCATLLQQSHLCPVPLEAQPVFWNYDHALHLYPIPDVLVLADRVPCASFGFPAMPADQVEQSCVCLNPVSSAYLPQAEGEHHHQTLSWLVGSMLVSARERAMCTLQSV